MAAFRCPRCSQQRSKARNSLCSVCYLLECLVEEHDAGEHEGQLNPSCSTCKPVHDRELRNSLAGRHVRRLLTSESSADVPTMFDGWNHTSDARSSRQGRTETRSTRVATSHASCEHERTPKARAKCRAERKRRNAQD